MSEEAGQLQPSRGSSAAVLEGDLLGVLSTRVAHLVERFRKAQRRIAELDAKIAELTRAQEDLKRRRNDARKRTERLITQVERLEREGK